MADVTEQDQTTTTPLSASEAQLLKAPKDKRCPFCGQAFTSSSLGRHLDLYIRPKNPKAEDGKHMVSEIRKIRGNITRRHAKNSLRKESDTPTGSNRQSMTGDASPVVVQSPMEDDDSLVLVKPRQHFSDVSWEGSGKTKRDPPRHLGIKTPEVRRDVSRQMQKTDLDQRQKSTEEADTAKATEMALKELLKSVQEANAKASGLGLFDFDPCTLNFPSLCLYILPAPSTLFSPTPFPTNESWSIHPPGQKQFDALNRQVRERLLSHQRQRQISQLYPSHPHSNASSANNSPLPTPPLFDPDPQKLFCHLADAYNHWAAHTDKQRQEAWQLEVLRSYARANDLRREAEMNLENARREIEYLKANRWSSGASETSPVTFRIGCETVKELGKVGMDFRNWDYERLIDKWKTVVRENKSDGSGMARQKPLPQPPTRSFSMASLPTQQSPVRNSTNQDVKMPPSTYAPVRPPTTNGTELSSDQIDAEGEDDDAEADIDAEAASDEGSMNTPSHRMPPQPTSHHPSQVSTHALAQPSIQFQPQAHVQVPAQVHAQAQAQVQAWAAARQHMNQSRTQHHPHQHQQMSPHPQHLGSAANSRRSSHAFIDSHSMNAGGMLPMDGIENHQEQFLRMGMGILGSNDNGV